MIPILSAPPKVDPRIIRGVIHRNSASAAKDNVVVYLASPKGEIELSPDGRLTQRQLDKIGYRGWKRCEAVGAREIEKVGLILSKQAFEAKKRMKVKQALRELQMLKECQMLAKIRKAQNFSLNDVALNEMQERRWRQREDRALAVICSQFDPSKRTTALSVEVRAESTSPLAHVGQKETGLAAR